MKVNGMNIIRRIICCILVIGLLIPGMNLPEIYASYIENDTSLMNLEYETEIEYECALENYKPDYSVYTYVGTHIAYNNWWILKNYDNLSRSTFHKEVQSKIRKQNPSLLPTEQTIYYKEGSESYNTSKSGYGFADLCELSFDEEGNRIYYVWEVKPHSYELENRLKGIEQINKYVNDGYVRGSNAEILCGNTGSTYISSGEFDYRLPLRYGKDYVEEITYTVKYHQLEPALEGDNPIFSFNDYPNQAGIIIYDFTRKANKYKKEEETQEQEQKQSAYQPEYYQAVNESVSHATNILEEEQQKTSTYEPQIEYRFNYNGDIVNYQGEILVTTIQLTTLNVVVKAWQAYHAKIQSNPRTENSVSAAIVEETGKLLIEMSSSSKTKAASIVAAIFAFNEFLEVTDVSAAELGEMLSEEDVETLDGLIFGIQSETSEYDKAGTAQPPRDPLIIDLGKSGIDLYSLENGVNFDLDNNGFAEKTAWIGEEDGFLALDRNGNGKIDNGGELFGDQVVLKDGSISTSGFEALSEFDEDYDNQITSNDSVYAELLVWIDNDHSGTSESDELKSLTQIDGKEIVSISLNYVEVSFVDKETGSRIAETAEVIMNENGNTRLIEISEFWFPVNSSDTTQGDNVTAGNVPDISQAIHDDESGELYALCYEFSKSTDISQKRYYLKQILYYVTGSTDIDVDSRGGNIDARDLHVIEQFMGREFEGVGGKNPNTNAAAILKNIYSNIENQYYNILNMYSSFGGYIKTVDEYEDDNGNKYLDLKLLHYIFDSKVANGENIDSLIYDLGIYLKSYDKMHGTSYYTEYKERYSDNYAQMIKLTESSVTYLGVDSNDSYNGTNNNDFIFGKAGNDKLYGLVGHDYMYGSIGNDILYGGIGDDSYCFELFHGNDVIYDTDGDNKLVFNEDLDFNAYNISIEVNGGFILTNKYTDETISLPDFLTNPINYDFIFNGETQTLGGGESREVIEGTAEDNYLEAGDGFNVFYGGDGNDTLAGGANMDFMYGENGDDLLLGRNGVNVLFGGTGNDTIYDGDDGSYLNGGDGDDSLYGGGGADVLDGGAGNDYLQADHGNDTYVFGKGYDTDTINASSDLNTVIIHGYRSTDMLNTRNAHNDLIINFKNSDDCLIIDHFFDYNSNRDFNFVFDNGTVLGQYDITAKYAPIDGTDADEWLAIQNSDDGIIHGNGGNDGVSGGSGNDELYGDSGDDTLYGNDGNDILDGGTGTDGLNGGNGTDTYIFAKGYGNDTVNEWGSDHSIIKLTDINSDEVTVTDQYGSNLLLSVIDTEDTLVISNFKWGQATYTFEFADGAVATVNKDTWVFEFSQLPVVSEEEEVTTSDTTTVTDETIVETEVSVETTENEEIQSTEESDTSVETENTDSRIIVETDDTTTDDLVDESDSTETEEVTEQNDSQEADAAEDVTEETGSNIIDETETSVETDVTE